jgi:hypothetical protein
MFLARRLWFSYRTTLKLRTMKKEMNKQAAVDLMLSGSIDAYIAYLKTVSLK